MNESVLAKGTMHKLEYAVNITKPTCLSKAYIQHYLPSPSPAEYDDAVSATNGRTLK